MDDLPTNEEFRAYAAQEQHELELVAAERDTKCAILCMLADCDTDMVSAAAICTKLGFKKSQLRLALEVWPSSSYSP